ncbi:VolA/Pla-1 family phospholipase [Moritella dasanensis]|uniref:VolA/Pla-1 family phospholipase n=1 Tax=Moritella dasanensis TaxID=428031 RepID=UPI0002FC5832|nr:VolA/Pla-1 family phospholipase [Moritella dasanensis]
MRNKKILAITIASVLGLTACGNDKTDLSNNTDDIIKDSLNRQSSIAFDLISSEQMVSRPTYLLMDSSDGTLNIPLNVDDDPTDRNNPAVAMGDTDGWSPTQSFVIELSLPTDVTLTTDTALLESAIKIVRVKVSSTKVFSIEDPSVDVLIAGVDYSVMSDGTSLTVLPLNGSLEHGSDYIYAITDTLVDSSGDQLGMSNNYASLKNTQIAQTGNVFEIPQKVVWQVEGLMHSYGIANYENIIYSSWFTTSSAGEALYFTKLATALTLQSINNDATANKIWPLEDDSLLPNSANPNNLDLTGLYNPMTSELTSETPASAMLKSTGVKVHKGKIKLPSFLERDLADDKWKSTPWQSATPSLAIITHVLNSGSDAEKLELGRQLDAAGIDPENISKQAEQLKLVGKSFTLNGKPLDSERLITKYSPLPQVKSVEDVNFLLITPEFDKAGVEVTAENPVPVVIYQHGITSVKENILASVEALTKGYAILAIDLPLHGERALEDGTVTTSATADVFLNFEYLAVGRDNMRQAVADLLGLRAGIAMIGSAQKANSPSIEDTAFAVLDTKHVSFFGHSLGAITGISLQATIDRPMRGNDSFAIDKAVFANPGGSIPYLLLNSAVFGGTLKHSLMMGASTEYQAFARKSCRIIEMGCFNKYYKEAADTPGAQATIDKTFKSFAIAAQTVLETVDPFSLARNIDALTPIYLAQVKSDMVIPNIVTTNTGENTDNKNAAPFSPIAGTTPLIKQLGLDNIGTDNTTIKKVALINVGEHSSAIAYNWKTPGADKMATDELQIQISSFLAGDGRMMTIENNTLLD